MMHTLLVAYLAPDAKDRAGVVAQAIEALGEWIEVENAIYVLWTSAPPQEVHKRVQSVSEPSAKIAVIDLVQRLGSSVAQSASACMTEIPSKPNIRISQDQIQAWLTAAA